MRAQDSRQGPWQHQQAGPALTARTIVVMGTGPGPGTRESSQDSGKALGKSCYCVLGHPAIIVLAVMISVSTAIPLSKSVPPVSYKGEL